jgi:hypothetical protein
MLQQKNEVPRFPLIELLIIAAIAIPMRDER